MPCSFCKYAGHTKPNCPYVQHREVYVYQVFSIIRATVMHRYRYGENEIRFVQDMMTEILKSMSVEAFHALYSFVYRYHYDVLIHVKGILGMELWMLGRENKTRLLCNLATRWQDLVPIDLPSSRRDRAPCVRNVFCGISGTDLIDYERLCAHRTTPAIVTHRLWRSDITKPLNDINLTNTRFGSVPIVVQETPTVLVPRPLPAPVVVEKPTVTYDDTMKIPDHDTDCPICMEPFQLNTIARMGCGHHVCTGCLRQCEKNANARTGLTCCLCRQPVKHIHVMLSNTTYGVCSGQTTSNSIQVRSYNTIGTMMMLTRSRISGHTQGAEIEA